MKSKIMLSVGVFTAVALSACGGGSGSSSPAPVVTTAIDSTNAADIVQAVAVTFTQFRSLANLKPEGESSELVAPRGLLPYSLDLSRGLRSDSVSTPDLVSGVVTSGTEDCPDGGNINFTVDEEDDGTTFNESGSETFNSCTFGGLTLNGSDSYAFSENIITGEYSDSANGNITLTITGGSDPVQMGFNNFNYAETGNSFTNTYTLSTFTLNLSFTTSTESFGVLIQLDSPIVESNGDACPDSGTIRISGTNGTFATGTFNGSSIDVIANGTPLGPVPCN